MGCGASSGISAVNPELSKPPAGSALEAVRNRKGKKDGAPTLLGAGPVPSPGAATAAKVVFEAEAEQNVAQTNARPGDDLAAATQAASPAELGEFMNSLPVEGKAKLQKALQDTAPPPPGEETRLAARNLLLKASASGALNKALAEIKAATQGASPAEVTDSVRPLHKETSFSSDVAAATKAASPAELTEFIRSLPEDGRAKVQKALLGTATSSSRANVLEVLKERARQCLHAAEESGHLKRALSEIQAAKETASSFSDIECLTAATKAASPAELRGFIRSLPEEGKAKLQKACEDRKLNEDLDELRLRARTVLSKAGADGSLEAALETARAEGTPGQDLDDFRLQARSILTKACSDGSLLKAFEAAATTAVTPPSSTPAVECTTVPSVPEPSFGAREIQPPSAPPPGSSGRRRPQRSASGAGGSGAEPDAKAQAEDQQTTAAGSPGPACELASEGGAVSEKRIEEARQKIAVALVSATDEQTQKIEEARQKIAAALVSSSGDGTLIEAIKAEQDKPSMMTPPTTASCSDAQSTASQESEHELKELLPGRPWRFLPSVGTWRTSVLA